MSTHDRPNDPNDRQHGHASGEDATADLLRQALHEEAAMVKTDPSALHDIQQRTRTSSSRRSWVYAGVGAAAATAAVIAGVAIARDSSAPTSGPAPATQGGQQTSDGSGTPTAGVQVAPRRVAYVGLDNPRLYMETLEVPTDDNVAAMNAWLSSTPKDPDYTTGWPSGVQVASLQEGDGDVTVELTGPAGVSLEVDPGLGADDGRLAIDALLVNGNFQPGEAVTFWYNDQQVQTPLGVTGGPITLQSADEVRAFIQITNLDDGAEVTSPVNVDVVGNTFEGTVNWQLLDANDALLDEGFVTTSMGAWTKATIHLGQLDPGTYTIRCLEYSAEDGSPGQVDDKTFTVK